MRWWRRRSRPNEEPRERSQQSFDLERGFWSNWLSSRDGEWPEDFASRFDPELELQPQLHRHLIEPLGEPPRVFDVGAGPASVVSKRLDGTPIELVPVDPLAESYDDLLARHGVHVPVATVGGEGERLTGSF